MRTGNNGTALNSQHSDRPLQQTPLPLGIPCRSFAVIAVIVVAIAGQRQAKASRPVPHVVPPPLSLSCPAAAALKRDAPTTRPDEDDLCALCVPGIPSSKPKLEFKKENDSDNGTVEKLAVMSSQGWNHPHIQQS